MSLELAILTIQFFLQHKVMLFVFNKKNKDLNHLGKMPIPRSMWIQFQYKMIHMEVLRLVLLTSY